MIDLNLRPRPHPTVSSSETSWAAREQVRARDAALAKDGPIPRILIVSDDRQNTTRLSDALNHGQFDVDCVTSESRALESLIISEPDLILLDLPSRQPELPAICERLRCVCTTP